MDRNAFIELLHHSYWSEIVLSAIRADSNARYTVDKGIRDSAVSEQEYNRWNEKVEQSRMEISIISSLIDYMKGDFSVIISEEAAQPPTTSIEAAQPPTTLTKPTTSPSASDSNATDFR